MAFTVIRLVDKNKITAKGPVGFSWTTLFFGFFVPLTRNDGIYALIMLGASIITLGIAQLIFPFIYNKIFIQNLVKKGFKAKSYEPIYKDSKRLNVKKEKAMIRQEASIGADGIVAKTFVEKERSKEKVEIPGGDISKIIGNQEYKKEDKGLSHFIGYIIIYIFLLLTIGSFLIFIAETSGNVKILLDSTLGDVAIVFIFVAPFIIMQYLKINK